MNYFIRMFFICSGCFALIISALNRDFSGVMQALILLAIVAKV